MKKCLRSIERAAKPDTKISTVIVVIWHAGGVQYVRNWERAAGKGEALGPLLEQIHAHFAGKVEVLCHSMGNQFFAGMLRGVSGEGLVFPNIILFSPDLDVDAGSPDVGRLILAAGRLTIFIHQHDRILLLSSWCHGRKRLGRSGLEAAPAVSVDIVDMTGHLRGLQNHTHLDKKWVQAYWRRLLASD
ncbi:MAG: alpha/beta hydrolase [Saprospiraceae bacterium]|nr:alpha/beta hydrolase [Saprospiraceae bacterium]